MGAGCSSCTGIAVPKKHDDAETHTDWAKHLEETANTTYLPHQLQSTGHALSQFQERIEHLPVSMPTQVRKQASRQRQSQEKAAALAPALSPRRDTHPSTGSGLALHPAKSFRGINESGAVVSRVRRGSVQASPVGQQGAARAEPPKAALTPDSESDSPGDKADPEGSAAPVGGSPVARVRTGRASGECGTAFSGEIDKALLIRACDEIHSAKASRASSKPRDHDSLRTSPLSAGGTAGGGGGAGVPGALSKANSAARGSRSARFKIAEDVDDP